jgi:serine/threonine protein kinase/tetratricopeptide (TPR) repeat protein
MSGDLTNTTKVLHGRYRLQGLIARGGMGAVFRALDLHTQQQVAVKHLLPEALTTDPTLRARVIREGEALRQLDHPNIVKLLDTFEEAGIYHLVLEYIDGGSLAKMIEGYGALPYSRALGIAIEIVDALARAHHLKIVHRDLKPSNILIMSSGTPKLTDFGTALLKSKERLTVGDAMPGGTVEWAAPEVLSGASADERADIWSLGLIVYSMLAGQHPFQGAQLTDTLSNIFGSEPPPLSTVRPDVPEAVDDIVRKMLSKEPVRRPATARLIGAQLETIALAASRPPTATKRPTNFPSLNANTQPIGTPKRPTQPDAPLAPKHNLPAQPTTFIGRAQEAQALIDLLATPSVRLITVVAPGGMGKTRLALEVAERSIPNYPDGVYFVPLAAHATAEAVQAAIAEAIGFSFAQETPIRQQLLEYLQSKTLLLVLDNFEHLLAAATLISDIVRAAPRVKLIATSREKLDVQGEHLYSLSPLEVPADDTNNPRRYSAVQLFEQGARRARPSYEIDAEDMQAIVVICRYVEGVPLGILLAAGWVEALTPSEIAIEIQRDPDFLETSGRDVPERQRSLRATFDYSWRLLNDDDRDALARVSVFYGGFTRDAAQVVAGTSLRALLSLTSKSLVRRDAENGLFSLHDIVRQYAAEKLRELGLAEAVQLAHSDYYLNQLSSRRTAFEGRGQLEAFHAQVAESENLMAAARYAVTNKRTLALGRTIHAYGLYAEYRANRLEAQAFADPVMQVFQTQPASPERNVVVARALAWYARISVTFGDQRDAQLCLKQARQFAPSPATPNELEALILMAEGMFALAYGAPLAARELLSRAAHLYRELGDRHGLSQTLSVLARSYWERQAPTLPDLEHARAAQTEALDIQRALGDRFGEAQSTLNLGTMTLYAGQPEAALDLLAEARKQSHALGSAAGVAAAQVQWAKAALVLRRHHAARTAIEEAMSLMERHSHPYQLIGPRLIQTEIELDACNYAVAQAIAAQNFAEAQAVNALYLEAVAAYLLAEAHLLLGQYAEALLRYRLARQHAERMTIADLARYSTLSEGWALLVMERIDEARQTFAQVQAQALDQSAQSAIASIGLGLCAQHAGDSKAALTALSSGLELLDQQTDALIEWQTPIIERWKIIALIGICDARIANGDRPSAMNSLRSALRRVQLKPHIGLSLAIIAAHTDVMREAAPPERTAEMTAFVLSDKRASAHDHARAQHALDHVRLRMSAWALEQAANRGRALTLEEAEQRILSSDTTGTLRG